MPTFQGLINKAVARLAPASGETERLALSAFLKLLTRFGVGTSATTAEAALILTVAEEATLLRAGRRLFIRVGSGLFLVGVVVDLVAGLVTGTGQRRTLGERIEIIGAHLLKAGNPFATVFGVGEQVCFIISDTLGVDIHSVPAAVGGFLLDEVVAGVSLGPPPGNTEYLLQEGALINADYQGDFELEGAGFLVTPVLVPQTGSGLTFPGPPMPSWGRRS